MVRSRTCIAFCTGLWLRRARHSIDPVGEDFRHDRHHRHRRPRDSRQPRQPHRRGRRGARRRLDGPRRGALRRLDRRPRGGRAARRRPALPRQGRRARGRSRQRRDLRGDRRHGGREPDPHRPDDDRARRHAQQEAARRQRHPRRVAGRRQGGGRGVRPAALPLCRRRQCPRPAGADDEHRQWRRACRQPDRLPGIHGHADRRADAARGGALGLRDLPHAEEGPQGRRPQHQCRRRRRLRAEPEERAGRARLRHELDREGRLQAGRGGRAGARLRRDRILQGRQLRLRGREEDARSRRRRRSTSPSSPPTTRSSRSRTAWPRTTGKAGRS